MAALLPADPDTWHALDAPFTTWDRWQPVPGQRSRCGRPVRRPGTPPTRQAGEPENQSRPSPPASYYQHQHRGSSGSNHSVRDTR